MKLAAFLLVLCSQERSRSFGIQPGDALRVYPPDGPARNGENPFGNGGELGFGSEWFSRSSDSGEEGESKGDRSEVGRFLQSGFPESWFLDRLAYTHWSRGAGALGVSLGFLPEPDDQFRTSDDLQAALFGRLASGESRHLSLGASYQKTWHEGEADRDLVAAQLEIHPPSSTTLFTSALVDLYTYGDDLKDSGPELTQVFFHAGHRTPDGHGLGLFASGLRFPELLRNEYDDTTAEEIAAPVNDRFGLDGWLALGSNLLLYGRAEHWSDQDDSGGRGRARATWRDAFGAGGPLLLEAYVDSGKFSHTTGLRASGRKRLGLGSLGLSWNSTDHDQEGVNETLLQHAVRADLDLALGRHWFLALYAESQFGDAQDALSLGFALRLAID